MERAETDRTVAIALQDGGHVRLQPNTRDDGRLLQMGLDLLSTHSPLLRVFPPLNSLTQSTLEKLTEVAGIHNLARLASPPSNFPCIRIRYESGFSRQADHLSRVFRAPA